MQEITDNAMSDDNEIQCLFKRELLQCTTNPPVTCCNTKKERNNCKNHKNVIVIIKKRDNKDKKRETEECSPMNDLYCNSTCRSSPNINNFGKLLERTNDKKIVRCSQIFCKTQSFKTELVVNNCCSTRQNQLGRKSYLNLNVQANSSRSEQNVKEISCCARNSDDILRVMKDIYECYLKKNCKNCDCMLCDHLPRGKRVKKSFKTSKKNVATLDVGVETAVTHHTITKKCHCVKPFITLLEGKTPEQKEHIIRKLCLSGLPLPKPKTPSEKNLIFKVKKEFGQLPEAASGNSVDNFSYQITSEVASTTTKTETGSATNEYFDERGRVRSSLSAKSEVETETWSLELATGTADLGCYCEKSVSSLFIPSEKVRVARAAGCITPLQGKTSVEKEKILKGLCKYDIVFPLPKTASEKILMDRVKNEFAQGTEGMRKDTPDEFICCKQGSEVKSITLEANAREKSTTDMIVPPERKSSAIDTSIFTGIDGKVSAEKEHILKHFSKAGLLLPKGNMPSEYESSDEIRTEQKNILLEANTEKIDNNNECDTKRSGIMDQNTNSKEIPNTVMNKTSEKQVYTITGIKKISIAKSDRRYGCAIKRIKFKNSTVEINPHISSRCSYSNDCVPNVTDGDFMDNKDIKITVGYSFASQDLCCLYLNKSYISLNSLNSKCSVDIFSKPNNIAYDICNSVIAMNKDDLEYTIHSAANNTNTGNSEVYTTEENSNFQSDLKKLGYSYLKLDWRQTENADEFGDTLMNYIATNNSKATPPTEVAITSRTASTENTCESSLTLSPTRKGYTKDSAHRRTLNKRLSSRYSAHEGSNYTKFKVPMNLTNFNVYRLEAKNNNTIKDSIANNASEFDADDPLLEGGTNGSTVTMDDLQYATPELVEIVRELVAQKPFLETSSVCLLVSTDGEDIDSTMDSHGSMIVMQLSHEVIHELYSADAIPQCGSQRIEIPKKQYQFATGLKIEKNGTLSACGIPETKEIPRNDKTHLALRKLCVIRKPSKNNAYSHDGTTQVYTFSCANVTHLSLYGDTTQGNTLTEDDAPQDYRNENNACLSAKTVQETPEQTDIRIGESLNTRGQREEHLAAQSSDYIVLHRTESKQDMSVFFAETPCDRCAPTVEQNKETRSKFFIGTRVYNTSGELRGGMPSTTTCSPLIKGESRCWQVQTGWPPAVSQACHSLERLFASTRSDSPRPAPLLVDACSQCRKDRSAKQSSRHNESLSQVFQTQQEAEPEQNAEQHENVDKHELTKEVSIAKTHSTQTGKRRNRVQICTPPDCSKCEYRHGGAKHNAAVTFAETSCARCGRNEEEHKQTSTRTLLNKLRDILKDVPSTTGSHQSLRRRERKGRRTTLERPSNHIEPPLLVDAGCQYRKHIQNSKNPKYLSRPVATDCLRSKDSKCLIFQYQESAVSVSVQTMSKPVEKDMTFDEALEYYQDKEVRNCGRSCCKFENCAREKDMTFEEALVYYENMESGRCRRNCCRGGCMDADEERRIREEEERLREERRILMEEERKRREEEKIRLEAERKLEEERLRQEEMKRREEEARLKQEAAKRREEERKRAEEERKREEARKIAEAKKRREEEQRQREEEERRREEERKKAEAERKRLEEERRREIERKRKEEEKRILEEERAREEAKRQAEEERKRKEEEAKRAEEARIREEERKRKEEEKKRLEEERQAEEARRIAEAERIRKEEERKREEEKRIKEEERLRAEEEKKRAEEERIAEEARKKAEDERIKAEEARKKEEERKRAEEEAAEAKRLAAEAKILAEEERVREEARKKAEEERRREEEKQKAEEEKRLAEQEKIKAAEERKRLEEERKIEEARRKAEEERQKEEEKRKAEEEKIRLAEEKKKMEEQRKIEEEQRKIQEEIQKAEEARRKEEERKKAEEEKKRLIEQKKKEEEERKIQEAEKRRQEIEQKKREEEARKKAEEEKRKADIAKREAERIKAEEERKLELARREEEKRIAAEKREQEKIQAAEARKQAAEAKRLEAERLAELRRLEAERRRQEREDAEARRLEALARKAERDAQQREALQAMNEAGLIGCGGKGPPCYRRDQALAIATKRKIEEEALARARAAAGEEAAAAEALVAPKKSTLKNGGINFVIEKKAEPPKFLKKLWCSYAQ